jgi:hypothetical protein
MKTKFFDRLGLIAGLLLLAGTGCAAAQAITPGRSYRELRAELIQEGWKPDASYGLKIASGAPLYRFPEVLCGPQLCRGKWRDRAGKEQAIMILRAYNDEEYRVAPQQ